MFCAKCGKELPDSAGFCAFCGKPVVRVPKAPTEKKPEGYHEKSTEEITAAEFIPDDPAYNDILDEESFQQEERRTNKIIFAIIISVLAVVAIASALIIHTLRNRTYVMVEQNYLNGCIGRYQYDEDGNLIKYLETDESSEPVYISYLYDEDGLLTESTEGYYYDYSRCEYEYSRNGRLVSAAYYSRDNEKTAYMEFDQDKNGNTLERTRYDSDGEFMYRDEYEYDSRNNRTKWTLYDEEKGDPIRVISYDNEYDFWGNLVSCTAMEVHDHGAVIEGIQLDNQSFTAEYLTLKQYLLRKESLMSESAEVSYEEEGLCYADEYLEIEFAGLEASDDYLESGDSFFEIKLNIKNRSDSSVAAVADSFRINDQEIDFSDSVFIESDDNEIISIYRRGFDLKESDISSVSFRIKATDAAKKSKKNGYTYSFGKNTVLDLTETIIFDTPVIEEETDEESDNYFEPSESELITFGHYEQDDDPSNGPEEIEWIVLEEKDDKLLVISRYALDNMSYNDEFAETTWNSSSVRKWLNDEFMDSAFSGSERKRIIVTDIDGEENYVFLPDSDEIELYLGNRTNTTQTAYARSREIENIWMNGGSNLSVNGKPCDTPELAEAWIEAQEEQCGENCCAYWLRSYPEQGFEDSSEFIGRGGETGSYLTVTSHLGIRPAMWIKAE